MRRPVSTLLVAVLSAAALAACGGEAGDDGPAGVEGAESAVRGYLTGLVEKDAAASCSKLTPEYQKSVLEQNKAFAEENGITDCPGLITAISSQARSVTFEGQPLNKGTIDKLDLKTSIRQSGDEQNATVTGARGVQRYDLETRDGQWLIAKIERTG